MRKLSKNFHFQKTLATIVGRIRWDLGRMFFLNGVHNSKQSRAPCTKGTKNLKIQRIRKQQKYTEIEIQNTSIWKYKHIKTIYENTLNIQQQITTLLSPPLCRAHTIGRHSLQNNKRGNLGRECLASWAPARSGHIQQYENTKM